jgi:hypothetical protein
MRLAPEVLVLELFRDVFFSGDSFAQLQTRELKPDLRDEDNALVFGPAERAVISSLRGRRKQTKRSREDPFYAPAYPLLARDSWLSKNRERVIVRLLFEGAFSQHLWARGDTAETGKQAQSDAVNAMVDAFASADQQGCRDILAASLGVGSATVDTRLATTTDVYMQSLESGVRSTINSIHEELSGIPKPGTEPTPPAEAQTNREESCKAVAMQNGTAFPQARLDSNQRPLPCQGVRQSVNNRRYST